MSAGSLRDIRNRIDGVSQTRQITGAMYLLSSSRLRKLTGNMDYTLRYMERLRKTMADLLIVTKGAGSENGFVEKDSK
jgi:F-type H+-transporting ATPase subunit gamma